MKSFWIVAILVLHLVTTVAAQDNVPRVKSASVSIEKSRTKFDTWNVSITDDKNNRRVKLECHTSFIIGLTRAIREGNESARSLEPGEHGKVFEAEADTGVWDVISSNSETEGALLLHYIEDETQKIAVDTSPDSKLVENFLLRLDDLVKKNTITQNPRDVYIKGLRVAHTWDGDKIFITSTEAESLMNFEADGKLRVDLMSAAASKGYTFELDGGALILRKVYAGDPRPRQAATGGYSYGYGYSGNYSAGNHTSSGYNSGTGGSVYVRGYYRKDGTYVRAHTRSRPR